MTPAEVLRKAADLIEERGWWNGEGDTPPIDSGPICAGVAMQVADGSWLAPDPEPPSVVAAARFARLVGRSIVSWNDHQPNGEVVIAKLREVADQLEVR